VSLADDFFTEECNEYVRELLLREAERTDLQKNYLTFDRFNVRLD